MFYPFSAVRIICCFSCHIVWLKTLILALLNLFVRQKEFFKWSNFLLSSICFSNISKRIRHINIVFFFIYLSHFVGILYQFLFQELCYFFPYTLNIFIESFHFFLKRFLSVIGMYKFSKWKDPLQEVIFLDILQILIKNKYMQCLHVKTEKDCQNWARLAN